MRGLCPVIAVDVEGYASLVKGGDAQSARKLRTRDRVAPKWALATHLRPSEAKGLKTVQENDKENESAMPPNRRHSRRYGFGALRLRSEKRPTKNPRSPRAAISGLTTVGPKKEDPEQEGLLVASWAQVERKHRALAALSRWGPLTPACSELAARPAVPHSAPALRRGILRSHLNNGTGKSYAAPSPSASSPTEQSGSVLTN